MKRIFFLTFIPALLIACGSPAPQNAATQSSKEQGVAKDPVSPAAVENLDVPALKSLLASEHPPVLIDVRTADECATGIIEGAMKIDFSGADFDAELQKLDKSKHYVVYCAAGGRSAKAADKMSGMGFQKVGNLLGGMTAWASAGEKTVK